MSKLILAVLFLSTGCCPDCIKSGDKITLEQKPVDCPKGEKFIDVPSGEEIEVCIPWELYFTVEKKN